MRRLLLAAGVLAAGNLGASGALAQAPPGPPPAVGVQPAAKTSVIDKSDFVGRVQATDRVDLTARVTAFLETREFVEGTDVQKGDLLYKLESAPFEAVVQQQAASVADANATLSNASITLGRASALLNTPAGQRSTVDDARASQASQTAKVMNAQAALKTAEINLAYTEIRAPVAGKISRTNVTPGNVVGPTTGTLATIVSQDPMYVIFPISVRTGLELQKRYADRGGIGSVELKVTLPDGTAYDQVGKIDYIDPSVATNTDTVQVRGTIPNPPRGEVKKGLAVTRSLTDGAFVTVSVQATEPVQALAIPRAAVLRDSQGEFAYVVGKDNVAERRNLVIGQSTATVAVVLNGLKEGDPIIVDGIQRVKPGAPVQPGPPQAAPQAAGSAAKAGQ